MFDIDQFAERAAIMEYEGGMTRFDAETAAAKTQGATRWEARNAIGMGHSAAARDNRPQARGQSAGDLSAVQRGAEKQNRSVSECGVQA